MREVDEYLWACSKVVGEGNQKTVVYEDDEPFIDSMIPYKSFKGEAAPPETATTLMNDFRVRSQRMGDNIAPFRKIQNYFSDLKHPHCPRARPTAISWQPRNKCTLLRRPSAWCRLLAGLFTFGHEPLISQPSSNGLKPVITAFELKPVS